MVKWLLEQIAKCAREIENETLTVEERERAVIQQKTYKRVLDHYRQTRKVKQQDQSHVVRNATLFD